MQDFLSCHALMIDCSRVSLSFGSLSSKATVSSSIPRNIIIVAGPSSFFIDTGTPKSRHREIECYTQRLFALRRAKEEIIVQIMKCSFDTIVNHDP